MLARRIAHYEPEFLDQLCLSGEVMWARLSPHPAFEDPEPRRVRPTRVAPTRDFPARERRLAAQPRLVAETARSLIPRGMCSTRSKQRGASFFDDLVRATGRLASEVEDGLVGTGRGRARDGGWIRESAALIDPKRRRGRRPGKARAPAPCSRPLGAGSPFGQCHVTSEVARKLSPISCWSAGAWCSAICWRAKLWRRPGANLLTVLRRKEAHGEIRGGRFVSGFIGEQFARPEALDLLRSIRRSHPIPLIARISPTPIR